MKKIAREIGACLETVHRQCCMSRTTAALALVVAGAAGAIGATWFIAIFILKP